MLAPALIPLLVVVGFFLLVAIGAWPFGALAGFVVIALMLASSIWLVRVTARMSGPEPPHHS